MYSNYYFNGKQNCNSIPRKIDLVLKPIGLDNKYVLLSLQVYLYILN